MKCNTSGGSEMPLALGDGWAVVGPCRAPSAGTSLARTSRGHTAKDPDQPSLQVSHKTIYTALYAMPRGIFRVAYRVDCLSSPHAQESPAARPRSGPPRHNPNMTSIHHAHQRSISGSLRVTGKAIWSRALAIRRPLARWSNWQRSSWPWSSWKMPPPTVIFSLLRFAHYGSFPMTSSSLNRCPENGGPL